MSSPSKRKYSDDGGGETQPRNKKPSGKPADCLKLAQQYLKRELDTLPIGNYFSLPLDLTQY